MPGTQHFLPAPTPKPLSYIQLRELALNAVWRERDYPLGVHCLGRAILETEFARNTSHEKRSSVRSFAKIIDADVTKRIKQFHELEELEKSEALTRLARSRQSLPKVIPTICQLQKEDIRSLEVMTTAVCEMHDYVRSMCNKDNPRLTPSAFAELEQIFLV